MEGLAYVGINSVVIVYCGVIGLKVRGLDICGNAVHVACDWQCFTISVVAADWLVVLHLQHIAQPFISCLLFSTLLSAIGDDEFVTRCLHLLRYFAESGLF